MSAPSGGDCLRIRAWLGDYLDRDISRPRRVEVEEHLHACRSCARHLSELEFVELQMKTALRPAEPPADFTARVMTRVRREARALDREGPGEGFTERVMARVRSEATRENPGTAVRRRRIRILAFTSAAASVLLLFGGVFRSLGVERGGAPLEKTTGRWLLNRVEGRVSLRPLTGGGERARPGSRPPLLPELERPVEGPAEIDWKDGSFVLERAVPREGGSWILTAEGKGTLQIGLDGLPMLREGGVRVSVHSPLQAPSGPGLPSAVSRKNGSVPGEMGGRGGPRGLRISFPQGGAFLLSSGEAELRVDRIASTDPWSEGEASTRVQIEVRSGHGVLFEREGGEARLLEAGTLAVLAPFRPLRLFDLEDRGSSLAPNADRTPSAEHGELMIVGSLRGALGGAPGGRTVVLDLGKAGGVFRTSSGPKGTFLFRAPWPGGILLGASLTVLERGTEPRVRVPLGLLDRPRTLEVRIDLPAEEARSALAVDPLGRPVPGVEFRLLRFDPFLDECVDPGFPPFSSDEEGRFLFPGGLDSDPLREWVLVARPPQAAPLVLRSGDPSGFFDPRGGGGEPRLVLPSLARTRIPVRGAEVRRIVLLDEMRLGGRVRSWSHREIPVGEGAGFVLVALPRGVRELFWYEIPRTGGKTLLRQGRKMEGGTIRPVNPTNLAVQILDSSGRALAGGAYRLLSRRDRRVLEEGRTDGEGRFRLRLHASPRSFLLLVEDRGAGWRRFRFPQERTRLLLRLETGPLESPGGDLVEERGVGSLHAFRLEGQGGSASRSIRIAVLEARSGLPVPGVELRGRVDGGPGVVLGRTGISGSFTISSFPVDRSLFLLAAEDEGRMAWGKVVPASGDLELRLVLRLPPRFDPGSFLEGSGADSLRVRVLEGPWAGAVFEFETLRGQIPSRVPLPEGTVRIEVGDRVFLEELRPGAILEAREPPGSKD